MPFKANKKAKAIKPNTQDKEKLKAAKAAEKAQKEAAKVSASADSFFRKAMKESGNEYASVAAEGIEAGDIAGYMDTGSLSLNALVSGSMHNGFPNNKIVILAGEESTGKTYFVIECIKKWLADNPHGGIYYFETESAISREMLVNRGVDASRIYWMPVVTVQETRTQTIKILNNYLNLDKEKRPPMMFVLDSLGMLSTTKEIEDTAAGKETKDMTRAGLIKAMFRVLTLKLGRAGVPFLVTNHTYEGQGMFATKEMSGGQGGKYAASITLFLSSRKDKEGNDVVGRIITCVLKKGRLTKQDKKVEIALNYDTGLNRYYGLLDIGARQGLFKHTDKKWFIGGKEGKESDIYENPTKYFTPAVMEKLEKACAKEFLYGTSFKAIDVEKEKKEIASAK